MPSSSFLQASAARDDPVDGFSARTALPSGRPAPRRTCEEHIPRSADGPRLGLAEPWLDTKMAPLRPTVNF